jgi:hypothetical protein
VVEVREREPAIGDEVNWLSAGDLTFELVRDLAGPSIWEKAYHRHGLRAFGNVNPPLGKLLIGAVLAVAKRNSDPVAYGWDYSASRRENARRGNTPPAELVYAVRLAISACAALTLLFVYLCAAWLTGAPWISLAAPALLFASDAFRDYAARIFTDVPQLCLMLAGVLAFHRFLARSSAWALAGALLLAGLSVAVKFSSAPLLAAMALTAVAVPGTARQRLLRGALAAAVPSLAFVSVNPFLYPDPIGRTLWLASSFDQIFQRLAEIWPFSHRAVAGPAQGLWLVAQHGLLAPSFHLDARLVFEQAVPGLALGAAVCLWVVRRRLRFAAPPGPRRAALLGTGLASALLAASPWVGAAFCPFALGVARVLAGRPTGPDPALRARFGGFLLLALAATWLLTGLWLPLDWPRYYLRVLALAPVFFAAGLAALRELVALEPGGPRAKP